MIQKKRKKTTDKGFKRVSEVDQSLSQQTPPFSKERKKESAAKNKL